jgi:hypothetical protein
MEKILFVTQTLGHKQACGIGIIGKLVGESLIKSKNYDFEVLYTDFEKALEEKIVAIHPRAIIYNYHPVTTPWIHNRDLRNRFSNIVHIMLHHDMHQQKINSYKPKNNFGFKYLVTADPTLRGNDHVFIVNRLIPPYKPKPYIDRGIPIIGFQGFGPQHKGIHKIAQKVQEEFDEAIIRLHIPYSFYIDLDGNNARSRVDEVRNIIKKPNIKVEATHDFLSTEKVVEFLGENTINCYFYDYLPGAGLASAPDYALSATRPIAVTKSHQLRNFLGLNPSICIEDHSLKDIISFGTKPLENLYKSYTEENVIRDYENMLEKLLQRPKWKIYIKHILNKVCGKYEGSKIRT